MLPIQSRSEKNSLQVIRHVVSVVLASVRRQSIGIHDADDIVSNVALRIWSKYGEDAFTRSGLVREVARNQIYDLLRAERSHEPLPSMIESREERQTDPVKAGQLLDEIESTLGLSLRTIMAFVRRHQLDVSDRQDREMIATSLNIREHRLRTYLSRIKHQSLPLRARYQDEFRD